MESNRVYIIAEAGVNHNGSVERALEMVAVARKAGVDAVKFQTFKAEKLVTRTVKKAAYQLRNQPDEEGSQFDMLQKLELDEAAHIKIIDQCRACGIEFLSTPFDHASIDMLARLGIKKWKVPSGEITNLPYLRKIAAFNQEVILSTGMADIREVQDALLIFMDAGMSLGNITVLHCNTEYPTPLADVNLKAMLTIKAAFPGIKIGYSDHTIGTEIPIAAVAMGARVIEKHFTLDRTLPGPDHKASMEPEALCEMVAAIRRIETALGHGLKIPSPSESKNKTAARKSIVAAGDINKGELFTEKNLTVKRPGNGVSPMQWDTVMGRPADKKYRKDDLINL